METKETQCHPKPAVNATCLLGEKGCYENGKCHYIGSCEHKVLTNADRIRAMSDEELANWLARTQYVNMMESAEIFGAQLPFEEETLKASEQECLQWLKQPAD